MADSARALMTYHARPIGVFGGAAVPKELAAHRINHTENHFMASATRENIDRLDLRKVEPESSIMFLVFPSDEIAGFFDDSETSPRGIANPECLVQYLLRSGVPLRTNNTRVFIF